MSSQIIQLITATELIKNTNVAFDEKPSFVHDYSITWNIGSSLHDLFSNASYKQNAINADLYDVNLTVNSNNILRLLNKNSYMGSAWAYDANSTVALSRASTSLGMELKAIESIGDRLLEIVAIKLFGDASARAAIVNDSEFTSNTTLESIVNDANSSIFKSFNQDANHVFNGYVALNRITSSDDVNNYVNFNFNNLIMEVPFWLNGQVSANLNGPSNVGGNTIVNGNYAIPLLLIFDGSTK